MATRRDGGLAGGVLRGLLGGALHPEQIPRSTQDGVREPATGGHARDLERSGIEPLGKISGHFAGLLDHVLACHGVKETRFDCTLASRVLISPSSTATTATDPRMLMVTGS